MQSTCSISGTQFEVSEHEIRLRRKFGFGDSLPDLLPKYRFQILGSFWPQWSLHKRKCDRSGKGIVSIFDKDCKYPVWHRDQWIEHSDPPSADFDFSRNFFDQAWDVFSKSPIPHAFQSHNHNCEYTDDWYHSKNCYLCHSGQNNEDCRYCYGCDSIKNVYYGVFSFNSELCYDLINSKHCFGSLFLLNCKNVADSAFLYDCRDCKDCLFCFNLRNKQYYFGNKQLSKEEFESKKAEWDFTVLERYQDARKHFADMMSSIAWHRSLQIDKAENSSGNYILNVKDCENCYMLSFHENCANASFSGPHAKGILDSLGTVGSELTFMSSLPVYCYDARFCFSVSHCKFVQYSAYLQNCQYCFGCCGLVNEKYCILNKKYTQKEYEELVPKIIEKMKEDREWGKFFPDHFAPNPYDESYSGFYFPKDLGAQSKRPFEIQEADEDFSKKLGVPLPYSYYIDHIQANLRWMPFNGELREIVCAMSGEKIRTNWPEEYDHRILSESEYLKLVK